MFHIGDNLYSAKLVDLPCLIESQKTLDNKQMFKVADICQVRIFAFSASPLISRVGSSNPRVSSYKSYENIGRREWALDVRGSDKGGRTAGAAAGS